MPFNADNKYEPPEKFKTDLKRCLSKYLYSNQSACTREQYEEIRDLLGDIEWTFFEQNLTFNEESDDTEEQDLEESACSKILEKLYELKKQVDSNFDEEGQGWKTCAVKVDDIAKKIWRIWCYEREHCPRAGIVLLYCDPSGSIKILLIKYMKNYVIQYGFSKGKIEFWETILNCAIRECAEETGLDATWISNQIQNSQPIKKTIRNVKDNSLIEHYYYIIHVSNKNIQFRPNRREVQGVEWHDIFTVKCCNNCPGKGLTQPTHVLTDSSNYFMVNCTDYYTKISLIQDILNCANKINGNDLATQKYKTIHQLHH